MLNLGCGQRYHEAWTNLDLQPADPSIQRWNVLRPLPSNDNVFDAVYHSHLLEHLPRERAIPFLRECLRVLKPEGVLRVAVPDLEGIARLYLESLERAWQGDSESDEQHRWLVMELYDQTTREKPGGAMIDYLRDLSEASALAWYRLGADATPLRKHLQQISTDVPLTFRERCLARLKGWLFGSWRERLIRRLLGEEYPLLQLGRFRRAGEIHHWMYDRVALRTLLTEAGFTRFRCLGPRESAIPNWVDYRLDTSADGTVCKPDSLFVEAVKP